MKILLIIYLITIIYTFVAFFYYSKVVANTLMKKFKVSQKVHFWQLVNCEFIIKLILLAVIPIVNVIISFLIVFSSELQKNVENELDKAIAEYLKEKEQKKE